jgi:hypothetical protein
MSGTLTEIQRLVVQGNFRISDHGYDELSNDNLLAREVATGMQKDAAGAPIHVSGAYPQVKWRQQF